MMWYFHPESDCYFQTEQPLGMESFDAALCVEVDEKDVPLNIRKGPVMTMPSDEPKQTSPGQYVGPDGHLREPIEGVAERVVEEAFETRAAIGDPNAAASLPEEPTVTDEKLVKVFVRIRDAKRAFVKAHEDALAKEYETPLAQISTELKRRLQGRTNSGLKTAYGTVYLAETLKVACQDWGIFYDWIKKNDALDFLEQRVKAGEVKTYMTNNNGELPPGLSVFREQEARVRKPTQRGAKAVESETEE